MRVSLIFQLLRLTTFRHWRESWASYLLLVTIVAIGVGAFNGIRQASRAASANFGLFNEAVSGRSDFLLEARSGTINEAVLHELTPMSMDPDWHLLPVVEGTFAQTDSNSNPVKQLRIVGLDLIGLGNLPTFIEQGLSFTDNSGSDGEWYDWIGPDSGIWLSGSLADASNLEKGDSLTYVFGGRRGSIEVAGVLRSESTSLPEDLVIGDIRAVQRMLNKSGRLDRIEVLIADRALRADTDYVDAIERRLTTHVPDSLTLRPAAERAEDRASMTQAFRLNLSILSLIAILVGAYLILQALDAAVVRRRQEIATLRSLGMGERTLFCLSLGEAILIGIFGSILGIGVGLVLASGAVHLLADTVNALYFSTSVEAIQLTQSDWLLGLSLGLALSVVAGWIPARDAMQTPPAQILARGDWSPGFAWLHRPLVAYALLIAGCLLVWLPAPVLSGGSKLPLGGFLAAACWILGGALIGGQVLKSLATALRPFANSATMRIAISRLADGSSRHRLAVAGLVVAVGMVVGMLQMVGSFRGTIIDWFDVRFQAELYVSERGVTGAGNINGIDAILIEELAALPEVRFADTVYIATVGAPVGKTYLQGVDFKAWSSQIKQLWWAEPGSFDHVDGTEPALISETFARRFDLLEGGSIELETPAGPRVISAIGIFSDYGNEFGSAVIDKTRWSEWTGSTRAINTSLYLNPGTEVNSLRDGLRLLYPGLDIRNAHELRTLAIGIFEQTFRVTSALNGIGLAVAVMGLLLGLIAIFEESSRSWATLDYLGFTRKRLIFTAGIEGAGIACAAWLTGTLLGMALGWLLIAVINVQSFGWTLQWSIPGAQILTFGGLLIAAGYLCGILSGLYWFRKHRNNAS